MQVRLLGPVDVAVDGVSRPVRGLRRKAVLSVLALNRGEIVSTDRLIDLVWAGPGTPSTAVNTLQSHVSHLRQVLGSKTAILARQPGYVLDLGDDSTDVEVAEGLIGQGTRSTDLTQRVRRMRAALGLWRGRPLADVAGLAWLEEQARRLDRLWLQATLALIDTRLALGEHAQLVPDLVRLGQEHPLDEQIQAQLMLALYRSGRQADALAAYQRLRHTLGEELGIDPSQALRQLETAMLRQDPELDRPRRTISLPDAPSAAASPIGLIPAQLPPALAAFAGRGRQLTSLDAMLPAPADPARPATVIISAVSGTAGVGKTALAVHWAHRVADRFPDGQLYVNLRGFAPSGPALDPATALQGFLDAFGVPAQQVPSGLDAQAGLYRSLLAGKRVLVLLDNASDVEQVRPLLPGTGGSLALVTSRSQLTGLVATEGAHPLTLDLLTTAEARDLISRRLGADRVRREPDAVDDIIERCAHLPLALSVVAARAATHPDFSLAVLAAELGESSENLDAFRGGDPASDVRAVFSWSYRTLSPRAARLFRLLGLHPGPDLTPAAAASLAGVSPREIREPLAELTRFHLVDETAPGRYACHDLLCAYAYERTQIDDDADARQQAVRRMLEHYLHTAHAAARLVYPPNKLFELSEAQPGVSSERPADFEDATAWFTAERAVLLAVVRQATAAGFDAYLTQLAWALNAYLNQHGRWHDQFVVHAAAAAAARRSGDRAAQARADRMLAVACIGLKRYDEALTHLERSLDLLAELDDHAGQGIALINMSAAYGRADRQADALRHSKQALVHFQAAEDPAGQARALNSLAWCHTNIGDHKGALNYCEQALDLLAEHGDRPTEASTLDTQGCAYRHLGQYGQAVDSYLLALLVWREVGDRFGEIETGTNLGDTYLEAGKREEADAAWRDALDILDELGHPDADELRRRLATPR